MERGERKIKIRMVEKEEEGEVEAERGGESWEAGEGRSEGRKEEAERKIKHCWGDKIRPTRKIVEGNRGQPCRLLGSTSSSSSPSDWSKYSERSWVKTH